MLIIPRKRNEQLVIGDNIFITVIEIRGDRVRLGIEHPLEVSVHRKEVYEAIRQHEAAAAAQPASPPGDKVGQLAAALQARLGVPVSRDLVAQALREAGLEEAFRMRSN